jgi:hypothetical protein
MIQIVQRGDLFRSYIVSLTFGDSAVYNMDSKQRVEAASLHNAAYYSLLSAFSKFSLLP